MTCPIVQTIENINNRIKFTGGSDNDEYDGSVTNPLISPGDQKRVCDDMLYYINMRFIELARMKVAKLGLDKIQLKYRQMCAEYEGKDANYIRKKIASMSTAKKMLIVSLANARKVVDEFEKLVSEKVFKLAKEGKPLNISLGDFVNGEELESANSLIVYANMDMAPLVDKNNPPGNSSIASNASPVSNISTISMIEISPKEKVDEIVKNIKMPKLESVNIVADYLRVIEEYLNIELIFINEMIQREKIYIFALAQVGLAMQNLANSMSIMCADVQIIP